MIFFTAMVPFFTISAYCYVQSLWIHENISLPKKAVYLNLTEWKLNWLRTRMKIVVRLTLRQNIQVTGIWSYKLSSKGRAKKVVYFKQGKNYLKHSKHTLKMSKTEHQLNFWPRPLPAVFIGEMARHNLLFLQIHFIKEDRKRLSKILLSFFFEHFGDLFSETFYYVHRSLKQCYLFREVAWVSQWIIL